MVMIGTDSHQRTHTVVAVDTVGRRLGAKAVSTNSEVRGSRADEVDASYALVRADGAAWGGRRVLC